MEPPFYSGDREPAVLDEWISRFGKIFDVTHCPYAFRVGIATFYLTGATDIWWQNKKTEVTRSELGYTWDQFLVDLRREFFQAHVLSDRRREFARLVQGALSVTEYYSRFRELMHVEPHAQDDMAYLIERFEEGCIGPVRRVFANGRSSSLGDAYERAVYMERTLSDFGRRAAPRPAAETAPRRGRDREQSPVRPDRRDRFPDQQRRSGRASYY